jgi:hypothetical protein
MKQDFLCSLIGPNYYAYTNNSSSEKSATLSVSVVNESDAFHKKSKHRLPGSRLTAKRRHSQKKAALPQQLPQIER